MKRARASAPEAPPPSEARRGRWLWIGALALSLVLLAVDSARRLDGVAGATDALTGEGLRPIVDATSPTGYRWSTHRLVLPQTDGYEWLLEAEQELAGGGTRIRYVAFDDAPVGREVHWAGFLRWWGLGVARAYRFGHPDLTGPQALEQVAPWANTALLVVLLLALVPAVAGRFGSLAAGLFALGCVAVYPFYDTFGVGYFDHHGIAAMLCVVTVLALVAGGAGWVTTEDASARAQLAPADRWLAAWLPCESAARRWFVASGLAAAAGLWISAAAMAPVLIAIGFGAVVACGLLGRARAADDPWTIAPDLFRLWGLAGGAGSLAFYLLEYFPGHLGMRLEVNHPLYAVAFCAGGDLIARVASRTARIPAPSSRIPRLVWIGLDLTLVLLMPVIIVATGASTFRIADRALWTFHDRYISEFLSLNGWELTLTPAQRLAQVSLIPLAGLMVAAALWGTRLGGGARTLWRAFLVLLAAVVGAYLYVLVLRSSDGGVAPAMVVKLLGVGLWFGLPLTLGAPPLEAPRQAAVALAVMPALLLLAMSLDQLRWLSIAAVLWLGAACVGASVLVRADHPLTGSVMGRALAAIWAAATFVMAPAVGVRARFIRPNGDVITRDASLWLRRRLGPEQGTVLASPTATTLMTWFGGFRGVGTLYWENLEGLRASNEIYSSSDPDSTHARLIRRGVDHIAFFGWDGGLEQLELASASDSASAPRGFLDGIESALRVGDSPSLPAWLVPLPYVPPTVNGYHHPVVELLEVVPDQTPEIALVRQAQFYQALHDGARMEQTLSRSLALGPTVPGLALEAQLARVSSDAARFQSAIARLRGELGRTDPRDVDPADHVDAAIAFGLAGDGDALRAELSAALGGIDARSVRRVSPDRLSLLLEQSGRLGLDREHPAQVALAAQLVAEDRAALGAP